MIRKSKHRRGHIKTPAEVREHAVRGKAAERMENLVKVREKDEALFVRLAAKKQQAKEHEQRMQMDKHAHHIAERPKPGEVMLERKQIRKEIKTLDKRTAEIIQREARTKSAQALQNLAQQKKELKREERKLEGMEDQVEKDKKGRPTKRGKKQLAWLRKREIVVRGQIATVDKTLGKLKKAA